MDWLTNLKSIFDLMGKEPTIFIENSYKRVEVVTDAEGKETKKEVTEKNETTKIKIALENKS